MTGPLPDDGKHHLTCIAHRRDVRASGGTLIGLCGTITGGLTNPPRNGTGPGNRCAACYNARAEHRPGCEPCRAQWDDMHPWRHGV